MGLARIIYIIDKIKKIIYATEAVIKPLSVSKILFKVDSLALKIGFSKFPYLPIQ